MDKLFFDYDNVHIVIDSRNGEILELYRKPGCDNILKNMLFDIRQPFTVTIEDNGSKVEYFPVPIHVAAARKETNVEITSLTTERGLLITVNFPFISDGKNLAPCKLFYTALLKGDSVVFNISVENTFGAGRISEVQFPVLPGIYLGTDYADDTLVYPLWAGMKIKNPVKFFSNPIKKIDWRWQEYKYNYLIDSQAPPLKFAEKHMNGYSGKYSCGGLCMSWMDVYDKDGGVYFACHDAPENPCALEVSTYGESRPGLIFSIGYEPYTDAGATYRSPDAALYFHNGDWHEGAKFYRNFRLPQIKKSADIIPEWTNESAALFAHYDFKYQNGNIVHKYKDIPELAKQAKETGICHMLFAGWHYGGFDNGYPTYYADPELGTEEELINGIKYAKELGVHVTFYMNLRLHNSLNDVAHVKDKAIMFQSGDYKLAYWGNTDSLAFYTMCPSGKLWQNEIVEIADKVTSVYGIDGIYFDIMGSGQCLCFNPAHAHAPNSYTQGTLDILSKVRENYDRKHGSPLCLLGEHVCDALGGIATMQLNQTMFKYHSGAFPAMYRYTFPEHRVIDMLYPGKNLFMRPVLVAKASQELMATVFTNGSFFWVYDLVNDNSFNGDAEGMELLKKLIKLKKIMLKKAGDYLFCDEDGIKCDNEKVFAKIFVSSANQAKKMLAAFRLTEEKACVECNFNVKTATAVYFNGEEEILNVTNGKFSIPQAKACLIFLSE